MTHASTIPSRPIDVDSELVSRAEQRDINVRYVCERALKRALADTSMTAEEFYAANKEAIDSYNAWIAENGMPFEDMRAYK